MNKQLEEALQWEKMIHSLIGDDEGVKTFIKIGKANIKK